MDVILLISGFAAGLAVGALVALWYFNRGRQRAVNEQLQAVQDMASARVEAVEIQLAAARDHAQERIQTITQQQRNAEIQAENQRLALKDELETLRQKHLGASLELERSHAEAQAVQDKLQSREQEYQKLSKQFSDQFENLANRIFEDKSKTMHHNNRVQLENVLNPLKERIGEFEKQIQTSNQQSTEARSVLKEQIRQLTSLNSQMLEDARNLTHALKGDSKVQGNWGEMILEKVLEKSGLTSGREYHVQQRLITEEGRRLQPDVVVDLPDERKVVIDSKVSLTAYERYMSAENEEERLLQSKAHLNSVRTHIKQLSAKNYEQLYGIKSPDFVLLFIPIEPAFSMAIREDNDLYLRAFEFNIVIVTPSTLLASLSTISSLWKQEYQNRNVIAIAKQAGSLYDKFFGLYNDLSILGKNLGTARRTYDGAMNKLMTGQGNLVRQVEKIKELGAKTKKQLPKELLDKSAEDGELPFE